MSYIAVNPELFPTEQVAMDSPRLAWRKRVKNDLAIFTHHHALYGWLAFSMTKALEALSGYTLTVTERTDPVALVAGYGRLLDEAGLVADNLPTEDAAIEAVAIKHGQKLWNEEAA